ncbi:MAG: response regulator [Candidatus Paceibacterota bacterium]|jgi:CheY-like chemotaxis protein
MAYRIYLVDDDRFLLDLYSVKFKSAGHEVSTFNSGEDLITILRKADTIVPDAILLDLVMPGIGGFGALETIQKENLAKGARVIILSNQGKDSDIEKAKQLSASGYIIKASAIPSEVLTETVNIIKAYTVVPESEMLHADNLHNNI